MIELRAVTHQETVHAGELIVLLRQHHNVELKIGKGGQIARSAGTYAQIVGRDGEYVILRLNSGEQRLVHGRCMATVGAVSNPDNMNVSIGKAGRKRWMGRMPHNRGVTMNPIDHPHGGGEGRGQGLALRRTQRKQAPACSRDRAASGDAPRNSSRR